MWYCTRAKDRFASRAPDDSRPESDFFGIGEGGSVIFVVLGDDHGVQRSGGDCVFRLVSPLSLLYTQLSTRSNLCRTRF